jgi:hypothetical protein
MKTKITTKKVLAVAVSSIIASVCLISVDAQAKSRTKRVAEAATQILPLSGTGKRLMKGNIRIYDRLGWEAGRYLSVSKHGAAGDPGRYPGYDN